MIELIKDNLIIFIPIGIMSLVTFLAFGLDKIKALTGRFRISEATLLTLSLLGGAAGGILGMVCFRHKIRKPKFYLLMPLIFMGHLIVIKAII